MALDLRSILALAQQQRSVPGLLSMLRGGDPQGAGGGGRGVPQSGAAPMAASMGDGGRGGPPPSVAATMAASSAMGGGGEQFRPPTGLDPNDHRPISYTGGPSQEIMDSTNFPVDPYSIEFRPGVGETGQGQFELNGKELFGGVLPRDMLPSSTRLSEIPKNLQPLLAPSLVRYYKNADYQGGAARGQMSAPWTRFFAPNSGAESYNTGAIEHTWPGITHYDPWGRSMGEYPNLYS
jgi:hypothetical protein